MNKPAPLCALADVADGDSGGFYTETSDARLRYMVIRQGERVFVYRNVCPHTGMPLDFRPGKFLTADKTLIQCSSHNARFRIRDGFCVSGPCAGDRLTSVAVEIRDGQVYLAGSAPAR